MSLMRIALAADVLKAQADRRASLMVGRSIENSNRYLAVSVKKLCTVPTNTNVMSESSKPKMRNNNVRHKKSTVLKEKHLCRKRCAAKVLITPLPECDEGCNSRIKRLIASPSPLPECDEVCNGGLKKTMGSPSKNCSSTSERISYSSKALNVPTVTLSHSTSTESNSNLVSKPQCHEDPLGLKFSKMSRRPKNKKYKTDESRNRSTKRNAKPLQRLSEISNSRSTKRNAKPIKRLSQVSSSHSIITDVNHIKHLSEVAASQPSSLRTGNVDLVVDSSIFATEVTSPTKSHTNSVVGVTNLSSPKSLAVADDSLDSRVEIMEFPSDLKVQGRADASKFRNARNPTSAVVPHVHHSKKTRTINSLKTFQNFKKFFPKFARALQKYEVFLQNAPCDVTGTASNLPNTIFSVVSYFVHETGVTRDFDWDLVCLNLDKMILSYIAKHSEMMSMKTMKPHLLKSFCRLSTYLYQSNSTPKLQFLPPFSEDSFNNIVLNAVQQIPGNDVLTKSLPKRIVVNEQISVLPCPHIDETHVEGMIHSPLPKQEMVEELSALPRSDTGDQEMVKEESTLPRSDVESVAREATITSNDVCNNPAGRTKDDVKCSPSMRVFGRHKNSEVIIKFKKSFPTFLNKLDKYRIYLQNDPAMTGYSACPLANSIFTVVSSFVQETSVTEDFDWKFVCINIHKIVENYIAKRSGAVHVETITSHLKAFLKLGSYLQHVQLNKESNFLPFFSFDVYTNILLNALKRITTSGAITKAPKSPTLSSFVLEDGNFNLHKMGEVLVSDYVRETLNGVLAHGVAMEPVASRIYLIGMASIPDSLTPLEPSHETACRVQSVLMLIACLRNGCRSSKLSSLTLNDFSEPMWIDNYSALFRSRAYEVAHSHPSYVWWTATELRVLQYYLRHYRQYICSCTDGSSPLFPSPSRSTASVGLVTKSGEVKKMFGTVVRQVGAHLDVSSFWSHQLRYAYFSEMQQSGLMEDQMTDLAWSLGHIEAYSMDSCRIGILRGVVKRTITCVEKVLTHLVCSRRKKMRSKASATNNSIFITIFNEMFPLLCKKNQLIATQRHVLAHLKLPFGSMFSDDQLFLTESEMQRIKSSHPKKKHGSASPRNNCKNKRKRSDLDLPDCHQSDQDDNKLALDENKRLAVIDWLVKMP